MAIQDFVQTYYIDPIYQSTGYNIYNTLTYALILVAAVFIIHKFFNKFEIKVDKKFFLGVFPYMILGGLLRAFEDSAQASGAEPNIFLITPIIYFSIFAIAFITLIVSKIFERVGIDYYKIWAGFGVLTLGYFALQITIENTQALFLIIISTVLAVSGILLMKNLLKNKEPFNKIFTTENSFILSIHMFDASTTFVAIQYFNYFEQHVLPSFLINIFGPIAMFFIKLIVVGAVLYYIDKDTDKDDNKNFIKIAIIVLGIGPGVRNFIRMIMGV